MHRSQVEHDLRYGTAARVIAYKASQLVRRHGGLTRSDRDDVAQELRAAVHEAADRFDPDVGSWSSYVRTIVERTADKLVRGRKVTRREYVHEIASLSTLVDDEDGEQVPLATQIGVEHREPLTGRHTATDHELCELRLDVAAALATLRPRVLEVVGMLAEGHSQEFIRIRLGVSRRYLRDLLEEIRIAFVRHDLGPKPKKSHRP